jgi:hypothetical protein
MTDRQSIGNFGIVMIPLDNLFCLIYYIRNRYICNGYRFERNLTMTDFVSPDQPLTPAVFYILMALADGENMVSPS